MLRLLASFVLVSSLTLAGCFDVQTPTCAFACGPNGECPDDYKCQPDGYCHFKDRLNVPCNFSDAAIAPDLSASLSQSSDGGDLSMAPENMDLAVPVTPDMSMLPVVDM
jgi:hypothetical protein